MTRVRKAGIGVLLGVILLAGGAVPAQASDSCGLREAKQRERAAHRSLVRAKADYRLARDVACSTRTLTAQYGKNVGRWVWLAADVGWPRSTWGQLLYIINRESGGSPHATNASSGAAGLLQFVPPWYQGSWGCPAFDPYDPRANLKAGVWLWRHEGWAPWSL